MSRFVVSTALLFTLGGATEGSEYTQGTDHRAAQVGDPVAACCVQETCTVVTELECEGLGGYWLGGDNVSIPVETCDDPYLCDTGSCCGEGDCQDDDGVGGPMTLDFCVAMGGDYVGGVDCVEPLHPCPDLRTGACCDDLLGVCTDDVAQFWCEYAGHRYGGVDSTCAAIDPPCSPQIPAVSEWGVAVMTLLVLTGGTLVLIRRRLANQALA